MTERQQKVLAIIRDHIAREGFPPTYREIAHRMGIASTHGVHRHLRALETKGYVQLLRERARGIRLLRDEGGAGDGADAKGLPVVGRVAAGAPVLAEENIEERLYIDEAVFGASATFALRVTGDSMMGAGILDGDLVVIRQQPVAKNGDIVVALLEDEATVKRYHDCGDWVELRPENPAYDPIKVVKSDADALLLLGVVVGVLRRY